jgi:succinyl-diaminopimelate desuccinylase
VPAGDAASWRHPPFAAEIADGLLYGRGAVDMKGGVAAMIAAVSRRSESVPGGAIVVLITGDEEGPAVNGTRKLLDWARERGEAFGHCLLGEPTNPKALGDMIKIGRRGSLSGRIKVRGVQGHVAYPHLAHNPASDMVRLLGALVAWRIDEGSEHFDPSNLEITSIDIANQAFNIIPARAMAAFNIRFNDRWDRASLEAALAERLEAVGSGMSYDVTFETTHSEPFLTDPGPFVDLIAAAVEAETGRRPQLSTSGGTSDARFIKAYCPVVEFGLVGTTMHQVDECTPVVEIDALTRVYERVIERYFALSEAR